MLRQIARALSTRRRIVGGAVAMLAFSAAMADDEPGLSLQLARRLSPTTSRTGIDETGRALLRAEWKSASSGVDEAAAVDEMLVRLDRMGQSVTQLRAQLAATAEPAPVPVPATDPPPVEPGGTSIALWLTALAGLAASTLFAFLLWRRRRVVPLIEATTFEPILTTQLATPLGAQSGTRGITLAPPTIGNPPAFLLEDRPPLELDRPLPPPGDDQIPLELADILLSMGLTDGAAKTLEEYVKEHPRQALCHWLKLLEIYRRTGRRAEFESAARDLHMQFNVAPTDWQVPESGIPIPTLENYPHIRGRIQHLWRRRTCIEYLNQLLEDNRDGTRAGFPQPVVDEILFLLAILRS